MEFRTTIKTAENRGLLHHSDAVMLLGSCFSDNIGAKMQGAMMRVDVNPFGTIYNPMSIAASVSRLIAAEPVAGMDLFEQNGVWNSYAFHSRYSLASKEATLERMNRRIAEAHEHLRHCQVLTVTLGTAMVYRLLSTGEVVSNCHKVPQYQFSREMATVHEVTATLTDMMERLEAFNPSLYVIFTVSPIRHIADGLEVNSLSKAVLRVAVAEVLKQVNTDPRHRRADYFPAYEIMMDDLRDYRFYAPDMIHPSEVAVEYIWQQFQAAYLDDRSAQAVARCERVNKRLQHRPMTASADQLERFNADTQHVLRNLVKEYPYLEEVLNDKY
ncbi:MAG: GSCFA domain-containing protein [Muribaculaceae bacterium]|nr:GSCFA domain-containing protein [Muribaculaceae bacterium]MBR3101156.1 GSCFA domain-containing protein [Muribaculaceae bacterium]